MKKKIIFTCILIVMLSTTLGFVFSRVSQNMNMKVNAKDLSEYGLTIISPPDPRFDNMAAEQFKGVPDDVIDAVKPFSFLVKNTSNKTVVAHAIIWDCTNADGRQQRYKEIDASSEALTDREEYFNALPRTNLDQTIRPGAVRLFSLIPLPSSAGRGGGGGSSFGSRRQAEQNQQGSGEPGVMTDIKRVSSQLLARCVDLTVSIDGVFFDDGTFVGPDNTGFFDKMKAQVEAKLELRRNIAEKLKQGRSKDEIFKDIETAANADAVPRLSNTSTAADHHDYFRKFFANLILLQRKGLGDEQALEKALGSRKKDGSEPVLRKIK